MSVRLPSLCSIENGHPFVPTCLLAERRAQRQSRMTPRMRRHRRSRRTASLTERARCYACPEGTAPRRYPAGLLPCFFRLIVGGRSASSSGESYKPDQPDRSRRPSRKRRRAIGTAPSQHSRARKPIEGQTGGWQTDTPGGLLDERKMTIPDALIALRGHPGTRRVRASPEGQHRSGGASR